MQLYCSKKWTKMAIVKSTWKNLPTTSWHWRSKASRNKATKRAYWTRSWPKIIYRPCSKPSTRTTVTRWTWWNSLSILATWTGSRTRSRIILMMIPNTRWTKWSIGCSGKLTVTTTTSLMSTSCISCWSLSDRAKSLRLSVRKSSRDLLPTIVDI